MRKIIFSLFLILLLFSFQALAFEDTTERYITDFTEKYTIESSMDGVPVGYFTGSVSSVVDPRISSNTVLKITAVAQAMSTQPTGYVYLIPRESSDPSYFSFISPGGGTTSQSYFKASPIAKVLRATDNAVIVQFDPINRAYTDDIKIEIIKSGSNYNLYVNGVLTQTKENQIPSYTGNVFFCPGTCHQKLTSSQVGGTTYTYVDDLTTGSIIGSPKLLYESSNNLSFTWSAQLMRSYETQYNISLYSITNPSNAGLITSWNIPQGDNSTTPEHGYIISSRSSILGSNFGLYLLEMTRGSDVLTDQYFYYDQLSNPHGFPELLFLAETDINAEIRDGSGNGGDVTAGGSTYLYPEVREDGIYNFTYEVLESPASFTTTFRKIYNNTPILGSNIAFSGLTENYYVSLNGEQKTNNTGSSNVNLSLPWESDISLISFDLDYTLPGFWGYVKNDETQNPIKSATVTISNNSFTQVIYTDSNGKYYLTKGISEGNYNISATKTGYTSSVIFPLAATAGATTRKDIFLSKASGAGTYYATHDVTFTVLEYWYSSAGLPGVNYSVYDNENESVKNGTTGSKGTFTVTNMDAGKNYTILLTYNNQTYTEYLEPGLTEYNLVLNKEGIVHQYYNSWLNVTYAENSDNVTVFYSSIKPVSEASFVVTSTNNGTIVQDNSKNSTSGTFTFNVSEGDYNLNFDIEASDGSTASQSWAYSAPPDVNLFPASYPTWLKNTLFVAIVLIFLLAFGKSKNDIACGSVAVLTSLGYYFKWLTCSFNFVVLIWIIALGAIYLHYKRTGAVG